MANTQNRGYPKPVEEHNISDDVHLLIQSFDMIDADIAALLASVSGRALTIHAHAIGDITGLAAALAAKSDSGHNHALAGLSDTMGLTAAPEGYVLVKGAGGKWVPLAPASLFSAHQHTIADIVNLQPALDGKLSAAALAAATAKGTPVDADTIPLSDSASSGALKRLSWASLKATLKAYFDSLYAAAAHSHAAATALAAGFMSATDKAKLDGLSSGKYSRVLYTASATWTKPAGLKKVVITALGAGGGGGQTRRDGAAAAPESGPGGGGELRIGTILAAALGTTEAITVGAGGVGGQTNGAAGSPGTDSSFGAHIVAKAGGGGTGNNNVDGRRAQGAPGTGGTGGEIAFDGVPGTFERMFIGSEFNLGDPGEFLFVSGTSRLWGGAGVSATMNAAGKHAPDNSGIGGGAIRRSSNGTSIGGNGGSGIVIVEEFF